MVEIVGEDQTQKLETTCGSCAARLQYTRSERQSYIHHDYGGGRDTVYYIKCPRCGSDVTVKYQ